MKFKREIVWCNKQVSALGSAKVKAWQERDIHHEHQLANAIFEMETERDMWHRFRREAESGVDIADRLYEFRKTAKAPASDIMFKVYVAFILIAVTSPFWLRFL